MESMRIVVREAVTLEGGSSTGRRRWFRPTVSLRVPERKRHRLLNTAKVQRDE